MASLEEKFVLEAPLDFEIVVRDAIEACENKDREIIVVGYYHQCFTYLKIKREARKLNSLISVSYRRIKPKINLLYTEGPYFIEIDCFKFR